MSNSTDAQVKKLLKKAKQYLTEHEFEYCLDEVKEVLELDSKNYLAYIFNGKAYHSLNDTKRAIEAYRKAIDLDSSNILAWKGLYAVYKNSNDCDSFFAFLQEYVEVLIDHQQPLSELVKDITIYNKKFNKNFSDQNMYASYLKALLPDTVLGRAIGPQIQPYEKTIEELLKLIRPHETKKLKDIRQRYPLSLKADQQATLNSALYEVYTNSEIPLLYDLLINTTRDDSIRHYYEDLQLVYNYEILKATPTESEKAVRLEKFIDDVKGMVTVRHPSQNAWYFYFDLICSDYSSFEQLDLDELCWYVSNFPNDKGLANIFRGFLYCEISPFNAEQVDKKLKEYQTSDAKSDSQKSSTEDNEDLEDLEDNDEKNSKGTQLTTDDIITFLTTGSENSNDSLFGSRITISYYIHMKEYLAASEQTRAAVKGLANLSRAISIKLPIYKRFLLLSLATIYTYYEAPKNFNRALELYDRIEQEAPDDITVKIGKGFILIEKGEIETAKELLREAVKTTNNREAETELAWCQIQSDEVEEGRATLERILEQSTATDLSTLEKRAMILWRLGESYLLEAKQAKEKDILVKKAYDCIIQSLKQSKTYAPSYTSLGLIYKNYYNDEAKAMKCFYKSFEADNSDLTSARELVTHYADLQEWPMCQVLCERIITNEVAKRALTISKIEDNSWPYRVLGICYLQAQEDAKSVEYFQNAIRLNSSDTVSWSCLGEAYFSCGRYEAALKVYEHCAKFVDLTDYTSMDNWHILYMLASVHSSIGNFVESVRILEELLSFQIKDFSIIKLYCQTLSQQAEFNVANGFIGRGIDSCLKLIQVIHENISSNEFLKSQILWKSLSDSLTIFLYSQSYIEKLDISKVQQIVDQVSPSSDFMLGLENDILDDEDNTIHKIINLLIKCSKNAAEVLPSRSPRDLRASVYYNLGINYLQAVLLCNGESDVCLQNGIKSFKKSLQLNDKEASCWTGLGIASFLNSDASSSQHCFIKSLALSSKDPAVWCDLALLYMKYNDLELSKETFRKVQALTPESNIGWLGTAMTEEISGNKEQAWKYYIHGFVLSNGRSTLAQIVYSNSVLQKSIGTQTDKRDLDAVQELTVANFAIFSYLKKFPSDLFAIQIALTILERLGDYQKAIELCENLCATLEESFEKSEDEKILIGFARAKSTLGRLYLGGNNYESALESAQFALDVSDGNIAEDDEEAMKIILSSRVVIGLGSFFLNDFKGALEQLKLILAHQEAQGDSIKTKQSLFVLVSQILYANGTEESIQAAIDELFTYIEENNSSLLIALTLGSIAVVENIVDILPAVKSDLLNLELPEIINDNFRQIPFFISEINKRLELSGEAYDQRSAFMFPNDMKVWENLNNTMGLTIGSVSGQVSSDQLSETLINCGELRQIQRGLFLNPSNVTGYKSLSSCLSG